MNKRKLIKITVIVLAVAVVAGLLIARLRKRPVTELTDAKTVYMNAADAARDIRSYVLEITKAHQITAGGNTYSENANILLSCLGLGSDEMKVCKEETLTSGKHHTEYSEVFSDDTLFTAINESYFKSMIASADYVQKMIPIALLDCNLYNAFSGVDSGEEYVVHIADAIAPEAWAYTGDITFTNASGTAYINYAGKLTKCVYILEYKILDASHRVTFTAQLTEKTPEISVPDNTQNYTQIQYSDGPKMLERATGFLTQIDNIRSVNKETTYFQAFGDTRTKTVALEVKNDIDWSAKVETETVLSNESLAGQDSIYKQSETFKLGVYELEITGIPSTQNLDISEEEMQEYCLNNLISTVLLPKDIAQCQKEENNGIVRITYTANKDFAQQISQNACDTLYQNPNMLTELSEKDMIDEIIAYLEFDASSGLPLSSGILYSCTYTAEGLPYQFRFEANQTYQVTN